MSEQFFKTFSYAFTLKGLSAHFAIDRTPEGMFWNLNGVEVRQKDALSSRLGISPITAFGGTGTPLRPNLVSPVDTNVHTLSRLKSTVGNTYRYGGANQNLYRRAGDIPGAYSLVSALNQMSGNGFSAATYRPNNSSFPYIFFADSAAMLKDNGTFLPLQQWGIFPPIQAMSAAIIAAFVDTPIDFFGTDFSVTPQYPAKTVSGFIPGVFSQSITSVTRTGGTVTVVLVGPHNLQDYVGQGGGAPQVVFQGITDTSFNGTFAVSVASANSLFYQQPGAPNSSSSGGTAFSFNHTFRSQTTITGMITGGEINIVTPASMTNIIAGMSLAVDPISGTGGIYEQVFVISTTATTFTAFFSNDHNPGATLYAVSYKVTSNVVPSVSIIGAGPFNLDVLGSGAPADNGDILTLGLLLSVVSNVASVALQFDVGDGSFANDFYSMDIPLGSFANNVWSQFSAIRGSFVATGGAGLPGKTWANVNAYRILFTITAAITAEVADLYMYSSGGPDVGPGSPYDYRYTYFNINTGDESNPSAVMVPAAFVSPTGQAVTLTFMEPNDPQVTHINIYRRGGTLNVGWTMIAQIPAIPLPPPPTTTLTIVDEEVTAVFPYALGSYVDVFLDADIASNEVLEIDNDPPLTTTLPVPVNSFLGTGVSAGSFQWVTPLSMASIFVNQLITVDVGNSQEVVTVVDVSATQFLAYFQTTHAASAPISASTRQGRAVNLVTMAFDQAWFAGDPDNPNRLYYSKVTNPEAVPPENWIEIGTPADPIMSVIFQSGQLFVETQARLWRVIIPYPGAIPTPYPTGSRTGLYANFANCIAEGVLPYLSQDGVYLFTGENSSYVSEVIEWLLANKEPNLGPVPEADPTQLSNSIMAFYKNEIFLAYMDKAGAIIRVALDLTAKTWRNDDVAATAMYFEEDTKLLIIGKNNGMVYQDRVGDIDSDVSIDFVTKGYLIIQVPINVNIQTESKDQGLPLNNKVYNELTIDADFTGQEMDVALLFDNGTTVLDMGTFTTVGRQRIPIAINEGDGQLSQNVALRVTGAVTGVVHVFNWHIKAAVDAEFRTSFDSYWAKLGTDHWKIVKQGWFEYQAADPAGISFSVYIEGNMQVPAYTFTLPQTSVRKTERVRFPAVKATLWRFVADSDSEFQLFGESFIEWKDTTVDSGYQKANLGQMLTAQGSV